MADLGSKVSDKLHELLGISDPSTAEFLTGLCHCPCQSASTYQFLQKIQEIKIMGVTDSVSVFAKELWRRMPNEVFEEKKVQLVKARWEKWLEGRGKQLVGEQWKKLKARGKQWLEKRWNQWVKDRGKLQYKELESLSEEQLYEEFEKMSGMMKELLRWLNHIDLLRLVLMLVLHPLESLNQLRRRIWEPGESTCIKRVKISGDIHNNPGPGRKNQKEEEKERNKFAGKKKLRITDYDETMREEHGLSLNGEYEFEVTPEGYICLATCEEARIKSGQVWLNWEAFRGHNAQYHGVKIGKIHMKGTTTCEVFKDKDKKECRRRDAEGCTETFFWYKQEYEHWRNEHQGKVQGKGEGNQPKIINNQPPSFSSSTESSDIEHKNVSQATDLQSRTTTSLHKDESELNLLQQEVKNDESELLMKKQEVKYKELELRMKKQMILEKQEKINLKRENAQLKETPTPTPTTTSPASQDTARSDALQNNDPVLDTNSSDTVRRSWRPCLEGGTSAPQEKVQDPTSAQQEPQRSSMVNPFQISTVDDNHEGAYEACRDDTQTSIPESVSNLSDVRRISNVGKATVSQDGTPLDMSGDDALLAPLGVPYGQPACTDLNEGLDRDTVSVQQARQQALQMTWAPLVTDEFSNHGDNRQMQNCTLSMQEDLENVSWLDGIMPDDPNFGQPDDHLGLNTVNIKMNGEKRSAEVESHPAKRQVLERHESGGQPRPAGFQPDDPRM